MNYDFQYIREHICTNLIWSSNNNLHRHTFWEFAICLSGEYQNDIEGVDEELILKESNIILLRPEDIHNPHGYKNGHFHRDIYVSEDQMKRICDSFDLTLYATLKKSPVQLNFYVSKLELDILTKDLDYLGLIQNQDTPEVKRMLSVVVSYILGLWLKKSSQKRQIPEEIVKLVNRINSGAFLNNSIEEIVSMTYYSHAYLCKIFKKYMGVSLVGYVMNLKMEYATHLLSDPNLRIIDISNILNYDTSSSFVKVFKKKYGISPNAMRKKILNNINK